MITYDELKKIASLAKLPLDSEDTEVLAADMADIMAVANSIDEADLTRFDCSGGAEAAQLREDKPAPSLDADKILKNAAVKRDGYFAGPLRGRSLE